MDLPFFQMQTSNGGVEENSQNVLRTESVSMVTANMAAGAGKEAHKFNLSLQLIMQNC